MASAAAQTGSQPQPLESGRRPVLSQLASSGFNGQLRLRRQPPTGTPSVCAGYPWPSAAGSHPCGRWPARASGGRAGGSELPGGELRRRASQRGGSSGSQASPPLAHAGCTPEGWELRSDPERITAQALLAGRAQALLRVQMPVRIDLGAKSVPLFRSKNACFPHSLG